MDLENKKLPLSISLGVATKTEHSQNLQKVIKSAEDGMYRRKLVERNSISNSILSAFSRALLKKVLKMKSILTGLALYQEELEKRLISPRTS